MTAEFMYLVMREQRCVLLDHTQISPIAVYFDKELAEHHMRGAQDAVAQALDELMSYRQCPAPKIFLPLDPTCAIDDDTNVGYSVETVPLVAQALGAEGLHPWMRALHPARDASVGLQTALGAAFARLKQTGTSAAQA
jgi:hypothetical protein